MGINSDEVDLVGNEVVGGGVSQVIPEGSDVDGEESEDCGREEMARDLGCEVSGCLCW